MDGSHQFEGRVEICINKEWGSVCDNQWDNNDAKVVCRQLEYPESGEPIHAYIHFPGMLIILIMAEYNSKTLLKSKSFEQIKVDIDLIYQNRLNIV